MKSRHLRNDKTVQQLLYAVILLLIACLDVGAEDSGGGRRMVSFTEYLLFPRIWVSVLAGISGGLLLMTVKVRRRVRLLALSAVFIIFAVLPVFREAAGFFAKLAPHPSPLCAFARPVMFSLQEGRLVFPPVFAGVLAMIALLSIAGNKLFCGWVCPIGALQEVVYLASPRLRKRRMLFAVANSVRIGLLVLFVPLLLGLGMYIYGYFNPFEILHWPLGTDFWTLYAWAVILIVVAVSLFLYRPFCLIICPIGALTWFLEHISIARIRLRKERCNNCRVCVSKSPCSAMDAILAGKRLRPDCYACGACIAACPADALAFKIK
jgi:polyferredoxin